MPRWMIPLGRRFDPDAVDARFSIYTRLPGYAAVAALAPVEAGSGRVTVDGVALSRWESVRVRGIELLLAPVGEVARDYGGRHRVVWEDFKTPDGRRFPRCAYTLRTTPRRERKPAYDAHDEQALAAAREGMVLLKNDGDVLPLAEDAALNCFGRAQHQWRGSATGASMINPRWRPSFHQAAEAHSRFRVNEELAAHYLNPFAGVPDGEMMARARARSDTALVILGRHSGEMQDNRPIEGEYYLTGGEKALFRAVTDAFDHVIVILNTGYPIGMDWLHEYHVDALIYAGFAGMLSAYALMELLDGRANPSGHLPDTWPWDFYDSPVSRNFPTSDPAAGYVHEDAVGVRVYYEEDIYLGYRYFDTFGVPVAFPFGHGLSYTRFEVEPVGLRREADAVLVEARVTNAGARPGKAVAQLYCEPPAGALEKPRRTLAGFDKTRELVPGEAQTLTLKARLADLASFDEAAGGYVLEAGAYRFGLGQSLAELRDAGEVTLPATVVKSVDSVRAPIEAFPRLTRARVAAGEFTREANRRAAEGEKPLSRVVPLGEQIAAAAPRTPYRPEPLPRVDRKRLRWPEVFIRPTMIMGMVASMSLWELCRLNVCAGMRLLPWQDGAAGYTPRLRKYRLPSFSVSDANAGLNLKKPNIGFPASSVVAATFNREIAYSVGSVIAEECPEHGICMILGPGMNLHRSPLCGRHPEYFSEDPLLTGEMAGWHGRGLEESGVGCCYKHLFCNHSELGRLGSHSVVSERALRELYFRAFEDAFRVQAPSAVMTSYNALNGIYPGEDAALLQGLLRKEWGFRGAVMSDWGSYRTVDAVEMVKAGNCWITPGGPLWLLRVWRAARRGEIDRAVLENNVFYLLMGFRRLF